MGNLCSSYITDTHTSSKNYRSYSSTLSSKQKLSNFHYISTLGEGPISKVMLVREKSNQELYALKMIQMACIDSVNPLNPQKFERHIIAEFENPFLLKLHSVFESPENLCLVLEFVQGGSLDFHLKKYGKFKTSAVTFFAAEVLVALEILHKRDFVYRDLKPGNILIDSDGHIKLGDFGLATTGEESNRLGSNPEYTAPEVLNGETQGIQADFWSFGVLIYTMLRGTSPFIANNNFEICRNIVTGKYSFPSDFEKDAIELISRLLVLDPNERLYSHKAIKENKLFANVDWGKIEKKSANSPLRINLNDPCDLKYFNKIRYAPAFMEFDQSVDINASLASAGSRRSEGSENSDLI